LIGESIQNQADNKTVGKIDSVMLDSSGKVQRVVVGVGGFLGIGKKDVAIDWNEIKVMDNGRKVVMNANKDQLKAMPEYTWPKEHGRGSVWTASDTSRPATTSSGSTGVTTGTGMSSPNAPADTSTPRTQR
ncbi:MAG: PRC-barrel domain-containing protein, partial [Alphaproteobacteria bacterium]|nr:PRC-barrel domain-containing protein [Alphaproteobacteria bacterium]